MFEVYYSSLFLGNFIIYRKIWDTNKNHSLLFKKYFIFLTDERLILTHNYIFAPFVKHSVEIEQSSLKKNII